MKRRTFTALAASLAAGGALTACGGSGTPGEKANPEAKGRKTVTFWGTVWTTPENAWYKKIVDDFNKAQDEVFVDYQVVAGDAWDQKLKAAQAAGKAPDLYVGPGDVSTGARTGLLHKLDDLLGDKLKQITDTAKPVCQYQGSFYGVPLLLEPQVSMFYNKEMFEKAGLDPNKPPKSWDELYAACEKLKPTLGNGQFCVSTAADAGTFGWTTVSAQMHVAGHLPISDDWSKADATDPKYEEIIGFYRKLMENGWAPKQALGAGNSAQSFGEGKVAILSQGSWGMSEIAADYPDMMEKTGYAPWVTSDGDQSHTVSTIGNMNWLMDAKSKEPEATAKFMEWALLGDPEILKPFFVDTKFTKSPTRQDVIDVVNADPAAKDAPWSTTVFEDIVPASIPGASYPWDVNMAFGTAIEQGMLGAKKPKEALAEAQKEIQKVIDREDLAKVRAEMNG